MYETTLLFASIGLFFGSYLNYRATKSNLQQAEALLERVCEIHESTSLLQVRVEADLEILREAGGLPSIH